jgi:hypothetical protein
MTGTNDDYAAGARHTTIDVHADPDPLYVLELAEALPEIVRALNNQTLHHEAIGDLGQACELLGHMTTAGERHPQLAYQIGLWVSAEQERGGIRIPDSVLAAVRDNLKKARDGFEAAALSLGRARSLLAELYVPGEDAP